MASAEVTSASDEAYYLRVSMRMAKEVWDAIQKVQIKALATSALAVSKDKAKWLAVDADGEVWAFDTEPTIHESKAVWDNPDALSWQLSDLAPPVNFTTELYEISKILSENSPDLKELARMARKVIGDEMQWIAIDRDGSAWAYDLQPGVSELSGNWDNADDDGFAWEITQVAPPADFRTELYEINKLLNDDTE